MINKESILSVFTKKQTLLEYLTDIEKALNKAVLVSADIVDEGSNKCHFVFTFEDDTKNITPTIEFIKPVKGATIRNGVLYLTLADGTEVSAGSITASFGATTFNGNVSITGNSSVSGTSTSKDIKATNNCDAKTFGTSLTAIPYNGNSSEWITEIVPLTVSIEQNSSKVGSCSHFHFRIKLTAVKASSQWTTTLPTIAFFTGSYDLVSHTYTNKMLYGINKEDLDNYNSSTSKLVDYIIQTIDLGADPYKGTRIVWKNLNAISLNAGDSAYFDFDQTINY